MTCRHVCGFMVSSHIVLSSDTGASILSLLFFLIYNLTIKCFQSIMKIPLITVICSGD